MLSLGELSSTGILPPVERRCQQVASAYFTIGRKKLADSQFPESIRNRDGYVLHRPSSWR